MRLKKIIENLGGVERIEGKTGVEIKGIACDSRLVKPDYLFIATKGSKVNGADFINDAIERGASAVLLDSGEKGIFKKGYTFIYVKDAKAGLAQASQSYFGDMSGKMRLIGVTGTNGKTTITYLLESMFKSRGEAAGVIGTVNYRFGSRLIPALNTTPGVLELYSLLSSMYKGKIKTCVMEISSHSLEQGRVDTLFFDAAVFTNLTREHMDFHRDMDDYLKAKIKLFGKIKKGGSAVINIDDPASEKVIKHVKENVITYGIERKADIAAKGIDLSCRGLKFKLYSPKGSVEIESNLIGRHNVYNILAACGAGLAIGMDLKDIKKGAEAMKGIPGRLENITCGQNFSVYVDYAHTEDGLEKVLKSLRELKPARLISVFGCGGSRDRSKRPAMGKISTDLSSLVFITSDNPRNEEPIDIINEIIKGIGPEKDNYMAEPDRFIAIKKALAEAREGDIVLVAGKGHETCQIFKDTTVPFDDRLVIKRILKEAGLCLQSETY